MSLVDQLVGARGAAAANPPRSRDPAGRRRPCRGRPARRSGSGCAACARSGTPFPAPFNTVSGGIWLWGDVYAWLRHHDYGRDTGLRYPTLDEHVRIDRHIVMNHRDDEPSGAVSERSGPVRRPRARGHRGHPSRTDRGPQWAQQFLAGGGAGRGRCLGRVNRPRRQRESWPPGRRSRGCATPASGSCRGTDGARGRRAPRRCAGGDRRRRGRSAPTTGAAVRRRRRGWPRASRTRPRPVPCSSAAGGHRRDRKDRPPQHVRSLDHGHESGSRMPGLADDHALAGVERRPREAGAGGQAAHVTRCAGGRDAPRPPRARCPVARCAAGAAPRRPERPASRARSTARFGVGGADDVHRRPLVQGVDDVVGGAVAGEPGTGPHGQRRAGGTHG